MTIFQKQKLILHGFTKAYFIEYIQTKCTEEDIKHTDKLVQDWEKVARIFETMQSTESRVADSIQVLPVSESIARKLKPVQESSIFQNTYSKTNWEFKIVEIDKLITLQNGVYLDFIEKLKNKLPQKLTEDALVDFTISLKKDYAPISRLKNADNQVIYSSDSSDLRVIGSFSQPIETVTLPNEVMTGIPVRCLITLVGYGLPIANVLAMGNRLVLNNGFHRLYVLRSLGITHAPVLLQRIVNIQDVPTAIQTNFINLISMPRPPLMKDYFSNELTAAVNINPRKKVVKVTIESETFDVPFNNT